VTICATEGLILSFGGRPANHSDQNGYNVAKLQALATAVLTNPKTALSRQENTLRTAGWTPEAEHLGNLRERNVAEANRQPQSCQQYSYLLECSAHDTLGSVPCVGYLIPSKKGRCRKFLKGRLKPFSMLDITPQHIAVLGDSDLRTLVELLCESQLRRLGLPTSEVTYGGDQNADTFQTCHGRARNGESQPIADIGSSSLGRIVRLRLVNHCKSDS
jgi:hypothetical protein